MAPRPTQTVARLLLVGLVFYAVAWFAPAFRQPALVAPIAGPTGLPLGNLPESVITAARAGPDWLPGWAACKASFLLLVDEPELRDDQQDVRRVLGATSLTNLAMCAALFLLLSRRAPRWLGAVLLACTACNASWLFLLEGNPFSFLRPGYFLWLLSFPLVGVGLVARPPGKRGPKQGR